MITQYQKKLAAILSGAILLLFGAACTEHSSNPEENFASCEGCHTSYTHLKEVYSPDTTAPAGGCGGEAPHYEPYDRVYMGDEGFEDFKLTEHYEIGCTGCHNGNNNTDNKDEAHSGDFIRHPSMYFEEKCGSCHGFITSKFTTSIHQGTGQKRKVTMRSGLAGPDEFHLLPENLQAGYQANCATCHGTCGNCHVVRPPAGGGGLVSGHNFSKNPDMKNICITCHTSRGGHAYLGIAPGTVPDVHLTKAGFECLDCHEGSELHGSGSPVDQRYAYSKLPDCEECHLVTTPDLPTANSYHEQHYEDFNCQVCHSQDYNNCGSCHIHGEGARIPSYLGFKIAKNPIPEVKDMYELALVRRTLAAPDNWQEYVDEDYANFDVFPTYNYTTPHNILRWTSRTNESAEGSCAKNCHFSISGNDTINKNLYLLKEDLLDWELEATSGITMDDIVFGK